MSYAMSFSHDQIVGGTSPSIGLPAAIRIVYVRHGAVVINGLELDVGASASFTGTVDLSTTDEWSQLWRWELQPVGEPPSSIEGMGGESHLKLLRPLTEVNLAEGDRCLFRLDQMTFPPGYVVPAHTNAGPGIRCLKQGSFSYQEGDHGDTGIGPGEAFFESGSDPCVAWGSMQMETSFIRSMVLDTQFAGQMVTTFIDPSRRRPGPRWDLLHEVEVLL